MSETLAEPISKPGPSQEADAESSVRQATRFLGGRKVLHRQVTTDEDAHELVLGGIPAAAMGKLLDAAITLSATVLLDVLGVSERSFARRKAEPSKPLPLNESERLWRFAEILAHATRVFGSQAEAEQWLSRPAIGLDHNKPIDLLKTHPGARLVFEYLTRIEHGVYT